MHIYQHTLLGDASCNYYYYPEFKTVQTQCKSSEGILSKLQNRVLQDSVQSCKVVFGSDPGEYIPALHVSGVVNVFVRENTGTYVCCDIYEPFNGYILTTCGGNQAVVLDSKMKDQYLWNMSYPSSNYSAVSWNLTELEFLIKAKCNNTYLIGAEYSSGSYNTWITMDLPW